MFLIFHLFFFYFFFFCIERKLRKRLGKEKAKESKSNPNYETTDEMKKIENEYDKLETDKRINLEKSSDYYNLSVDHIYDQIQKNKIFNFSRFINMFKSEKS